MLKLKNENIPANAATPIVNVVVASTSGNEPPTAADLSALKLFNTNTKSGFDAPINVFKLVENA